MKLCQILASFYIGLCLIASALLLGKINDRPLDPDATQNVRTASHLAHFGIFSYDHFEPPSQPTMKREPLPIFALAVLILTNKTLAEARPFDNLFYGEPLLILKRINVFWAFLTYCGICLLVFLMYDNIQWRVVVPPIVIFLTNYSFMDQYVNRLTTEAVAAAALVWAAVALLAFVKLPTRNYAIAVGIALACAALVKAALFYVSIFAITTIAILFFITNAEKQTIRRHRAAFLVLVASFLAVVGIWVGRNAIELNQFRIADRGGDAFYFRVLLMQKPIFGSVYAFSPRQYREVIGRVTGYTDEDLKQGGKLEYVKKKRWDIYREMMRREGVKLSRSKAQSWLTRKAIKEYVKHPSYYLVWPFVFAYRGSFFLTPRGDTRIVSASPSILYHMSLALVLNFLAVGIISFFRRDLRTYAVFALPLGYFLFHAIVTHSLNRYNEPITPFVWLAAAYSIFRLIVYCGLVEEAEVSVGGQGKSQAPNQQQSH